MALESAKERKDGVWKEHDLDCVNEPLGKYVREAGLRWLLHTHEWWERLGRAVPESLASWSAEATRPMWPFVWRLRGKPRLSYFRKYTNQPQPTLYTGEGKAPSWTHPVQVHTTGTEDEKV